MDRKSLAQLIYQAAYLTGEFKLRSGQISNEYFDKYQFESKPNLLRALAEQMTPLIPKNTEILAGLEMGGVPIATALSLATGIPVAFVRKKAKDYGTCRFAEGEAIKNKKVCVVEDVVTTGGQALISTKDLRGDGAIIDTVICAIYRGPKELKDFEQNGLRLQPLFTMEELKAQGK